jgi:pimeloyl-ACP methyl ester carboxylesterase
MASPQWSERTIPVAGIELPVVTAGSGKPVLVLHDELGYPGWLDWQATLSKERTLLIPMAPGFGRAPRIDWVESVRDLASVYARLLREEKLTDIDVIGFSFGGWVAAEMIASCPHQFRRAVLVAPGGIKAPVGELMDERAPGSRPLAHEVAYEPVSNPAALTDYASAFGDPE